MIASHPYHELRTMIRGKTRVAEPLSKHTTLRIGGPADLMVYPATTGELQTVIRWCLERGVEYATLGLGSNVLAPDEGLAGVVIRTKPALDYIHFRGEHVLVGAGAGIVRLVSQAAARGLSGVEGLAGVPGSVGGALVMNAGTRIGQIGNVVRYVKILDETGTFRQIPASELFFSYRNSLLQQRRDWLVVEAELVLTPGDSNKIRETVDATLAYRNSTQPLTFPSAGSVFKNPEGDSAGRLVEAAGCKGLRWGDAQVSKQHANWIINLGKATAGDVLALMLEVRHRVLQKFGVALEREIRLLGGLQERWDEAVKRQSPTG